MCRWEGGIEDAWIGRYRSQRARPSHRQWKGSLQALRNDVGHTVGVWCRTGLWHGSRISYEEAIRYAVWRKRTPADVPRHRIAGVDALRFQSRLGRSKPHRIGTMCELHDDRRVADPPGSGVLGGDAVRPGSLPLLRRRLGRTASGTVAVWEGGPGRDKAGVWEAARTQAPARVGSRQLACCLFLFQRMNYSTARRWRSRECKRSRYGPSTA